MHLFPHHILQINWYLSPYTDTGLEKKCVKAGQVIIIVRAKKAIYVMISGQLIINRLFSLTVQPIISSGLKLFEKGVPVFRANLLFMRKIRFLMPSL